MTMVRQPEQRFLSELHYGEQLGSDPSDLDAMIVRFNEDLGCATKMLARAHTDKCRGEPPTAAELARAKERLRTGFSFVGITDRWDLSICLFSKMFNQTCRSGQFVNSRPTVFKAPEVYDVAELQGLRDPFDGEIFD